MVFPRAPWYFEDSFPHSWELDPTEGPDRVRKRLRRCFLNLSPKFLRTAARSLERKQVLGFFHHSPASDSSLLIERLQSNEKIIHVAPCVIITPSADVSGELLLGQQCLYFVGDSLKTQVDAESDPKLNATGESTLSQHVKELFSQAWPYTNIKEVLQRRYLLQECAIEIFLLSGITFLLTFESKEVRACLHSVVPLFDTTIVSQVVETIWSHLALLYPPASHPSPTSAWRDHQLTNFQYLTQLNSLAGRSFNDIMQYPVFPFVLADYHSSQLDLSSPEVYRVLSANVPVQTKERERRFKANYEDMVNDPGLNPFSGHPYHFSSLYSNSGLVLQYLIRTLPFTYKFLKFQGHDNHDNNFDLPDRSFHSVELSWRVATRDSNSDVKEMIPEFFYFPEFLVNYNGLELGVCQNGVQVDDVELPPWCHGNARIFTLVLRQALESSLVTNNLHHWVDLIFGYKQTGKAAVAALNVYHPLVRAKPDTWMDEKNETQDAEEYTAEGENNPAVSTPKIEPPPPSAELPAVLARLAACLSALQTTSDRVTHRTEIEVQSFDGTYPAAQFFRTYDQKTDWDGLTNTEKVLRLPRYLNNKPLEHFRRLRMETQHYIQVRQTFLDLYPETNEATYAQYFSMKLAGQPNLEEYYRNKTALGLQLGLPQEVILETLTEGLPPSDQRLVRIVPPENLGAWFRLVQRIRGSGAPSPRHPDEHAPPLLGPYAPVRPSPRTVPTRSTPPTDCRFCGGLHWHSECRLRQAPQLPRASGDARAARSAQLAEQRPRAQPHHQASRAQATGITKGAPDQQPAGPNGPPSPYTQTSPFHTPFHVPHTPPIITRTPPELTEHVNTYPVLTTARRIAHERTQAKHLKDKHAYDQQHKTPHFEPGDLVLVKVYHHPNTGKLAPYFTGPYEILEIISPNVVRINRPNQPLNRNTDTVHVNKLQYYNENIRYIAPPTLIPHPAKPQSRTLPPLFEHLTPDLFTVERFAPTIGNCTTTTPVDPQCNIIAQRDIPQPAISRPTHITKVKTPIPTVRADPKPIPLQARFFRNVKTFPLFHLLYLINLFILPTVLLPMATLLYVSVYTLQPNRLFQLQEALFEITIAVVELIHRTIGIILPELWTILVHSHALVALIGEIIGEIFQTLFRARQTYYEGAASINQGDELRQKAAHTMVRNLGQVPQQLFHTPHPMVTQWVVDSAAPTSSSLWVAGVTGLRWGNFPGSPAAPSPLVTSASLPGGPLGRMVALCNMDVFCVGPCSCLLLAHNSTKGRLLRLSPNSLPGDERLSHVKLVKNTESACTLFKCLLNSTYVESAALIVWSHLDGVVRVKFYADQPYEPLLASSPYDKVCQCLSVPGSPLLFVGFSSGLVKVFTLAIDCPKAKIGQSKPSCTLIGHQAAISAIAICQEFKIAVTASRDGKTPGLGPQHGRREILRCVDISSLAYIHTISSHSSPVKLVAISPTLGDIASVSDIQAPSTSTPSTGARWVRPRWRSPSPPSATPPCLRGTAINLIAAGLDNGTISPIISLTYSQDNQHLLGATRDKVYTWEIPSRAPSSSRKPRLKSLHT
ncbi:LYST [Cordylochernes scorpioides]|uniref:LYST n=1 Tax=Cordylochernes scorpioides TaxID=51811 RepID=A0ABY6LG35_9ARAC|nr:LYST [Cordylochernes scorpioides]